MIALLLLAGCFESPPECLDHGACASGEACIEGECERVECLTSAECGIGERCDVEEGRFACVPGCDTSGDCLAGEVCEAGTCAEAACSDTRIDCDAGQVCNDGACEPADVCRPCTGSCGQGQTCTWFVGQSSDHCLPICATNADCPAGFTCAPDGSGAGICYADCEWLLAEGWL